MARSRTEQLLALVERRGEIANRDVARALGVSAATAHRLLHALRVSEVLELRGRGPAARYATKPVHLRFRIRGLEEDRAWRELSARIARVRRLPEGDARSLQYATSELINNAIDHSGGTQVDVRVDFAGSGTITTTIRDNGVGVYLKICDDFGFPSARDAIVQLEKGKLTSDPERHSGEGLFFTSKAVARFRLESQGVAWIVDNLVRDSAVAKGASLRGTLAVLEIVRGQTPQLEEVFRAWTDPDTMAFAKTRVMVSLVQIGKTLVSRSEARRIVEGLTKFKHVTLDFSGVEVVGQGFCDEVFRVFARSHPNVALEPVGMNEPIAFMVGRAIARAGPRASRSSR